jgi:hypothetical protein
MPAQADLDLEARGMVGAVAADQLIHGDAEVPGSGPLLQRRLGVDRGALLDFQERCPMLADKLIGPLKAAGEIDRAQDRLDHVTDDIFA